MAMTSEGIAWPSRSTGRRCVPRSSAIAAALYLAVAALPRELSSRLGPVGFQPSSSLVMSAVAGPSRATEKPRWPKCLAASAGATDDVGMPRWGPIASAMWPRRTPPSPTACKTEPAVALSTGRRARRPASERCTADQRLGPAASGAARSKSSRRHRDRKDAGNVRTPRLVRRGRLLGDELIKPRSGATRRRDGRFHDGTGPPVACLSGRAAGSYVEVVTPCRDARGTCGASELSLRHRFQAI
jgi:hypothetical protein